MYKIIALVLAGGNGSRFNATQDPPKQYLPLKYDSVINCTVKKFLHHEKIDLVQVVIGKNHHNFYQPHQHKKLLPHVLGGQRRQDSVCIGLEALKKFSPQLVLIHDAARPFFSEKLIDEMVLTLQNNRAVVPAIKVVDAIVESDDNQCIQQHITNKNIYKVQTPQGFHYSDILNLHQIEKESKTTFADDSALFTKHNMPVAMIEGQSNNIKITYKEDLHD